MKYLPLIWKSLGRKKVRTLFTVAAITVGFALFPVLSAIGFAFSMGVDVTGEDRLLVIHKVSLIQPLPLSYHNRLRAMPGVVEATHATWFGGKYQDHKEGMFGIFPVLPEEFLAMYPEYVLPDENKTAWYANRAGVVVGRKTADTFGWKVGDRVPIQGTIFRRDDGGDTWEFDIEGIYDGAERGVDDTLFLFHYEYFNEGRAFGKDFVGWYIVRIDEPAKAAAIADGIDERFANSPYETDTTTEKAFMQGFANQIGNIGAILRMVLVVVFILILLIAGNTMFQAVRERTNELGVLKTLGFANGLILFLVLAESLLMALLGAGIGLAIGLLLVEAIGNVVGTYLPLFMVPPGDLAIGAGLSVALGLAAGSIPGVLALRLRIVDALRKV